MNEASYRAALGGVVSSLCLFLMFLAGLFPPMYLTLPMIAGLLMVVVAAELGSRQAFMTYLCVSLLSLIVSFDKEAALIFIALFGHYPILKQKIEKIRFKPLVLILKLLVYNVCVVAQSAAVVFLLGSRELLEEYAKRGGSVILGILAITNLIFLMYDFIVTNCVRLYGSYVKPRLKGRRR